MFLHEEDVSPLVVGVAVDDVPVLVDKLGDVPVAVVQVVVIGAAYFPGQGLFTPDVLCSDSAAGV